MRRTSKFFLRPKTLSVPVTLTKALFVGCLLMGMTTTMAIAAPFNISNEPSIDPSTLSSDERQSIVTQLKAAIGTPAENEHQRYITQTLIALGDKETIEDAVEQYRNGNLRPAFDLEFFGKENVLPYFAADLVISDDIIERGDMLSRRQRSALSMYRILQHSKLLPAATKEWASKPNSPNLIDEVNLMTWWWEHNKVALLAKNYKEATWLPPKRPDLPEPRAISPEELQKFQRAAETPITPVSEPWLWISVFALGTASLGAWILFRSNVERGTAILLGIRKLFRWKVEIRIPQLLNCICYVGVFLTYLITGGLIFSFSSRYLPLQERNPQAATEYVLTFGASPDCFIANLVLGLLFSSVLFYMEFVTPKRRVLTQFFLAISLILAFAQIAYVFWALTLPMVDINRID